jgi:hypothetical protein
VFINYAGDPDLQQFHGKAIALDIKDRQGPFPSLFIIHEMRVRGLHPFEPPTPDIVSNDIPWQDWISSDDVASDSFNRRRPPGNGNDSGSTQPLPQIQPLSLIAGDTSSGGHTLALNEDVVDEILAHAMPSWKACEIEGTNWIGTAEENIEKYVSSIGVQGN